jgi:DNA invertase Pin-like site-specific DNA recombinase
MTPPEPHRAAIYLRMSLDRELGIERQREDCWALCERLGWEGIEYVDKDRSATKANVVREGYEKMLKDIAAGRIDAIITWRSDRLYRLLRDLLPLIDLLQSTKKRIPIETCQTGLIDLSTDSGRMNAKILAAVSENEGEVRTARQKRALQQIAESGRGWGTTAFGYNNDHHNPKLIPKEAEAIRKAYADVRAGATLYSVAMEWNAAGFRTRPNKTKPHGNAWNTSTVGRLLRNPRFAGLRTYKGEIIGKGDWPPIVDESTWEAVNYILSDPSRRSTRLHKRSQLLGGILRCGLCGKGLSSGVNKSRGEPYRQYRCKNYGECSGSPIRQAKPLDDWVRDLVIKRLASGDWVKNTVMGKEEAEALRDEASNIQLRMDSLANDFAEGDLTASQLRVATASLRAKLDEIDSKLTHATGTQVFEGLLGVTDFEAYWEDELDVDKRRALIRALCDKILVNPLGVKGRAAGKLPVGTGIEVHWRNPEDL